MQKDGFPVPFVEFVDGVVEDRPNLLPSGFTR
jgi:hypothetical protein